MRHVIGLARTVINKRENRIALLVVFDVDGEIRSHAVFYSCAGAGAGVVNDKSTNVVGESRLEVHHEQSAAHSVQVPVAAQW